MSTINKSPSVVPPPETPLISEKPAATPPLLPASDFELKDDTRPTSAKAPPKEKKPAFKGKEKPSIKYTIDNLSSLSTGPKGLTDSAIAPRPQEPKPVGTYFNSLNIKGKLTTDKGTYFTIDVQPDMRFITFYTIYTTCEDYAGLVVDNNPFVSIPSLIGYKLILFAAQNLLFDIHARQTKSASCLPFEDSTRKASLLQTLMNCHVPTDMQLPLEQLAPTFDPLRPDLEFVPSFASFSFKHDFGRTIPPIVFFMIHNILANAEDDVTPLSIMTEIYETTFTTVEGQQLSISNLFGGPYLDGNVAASHDNWFRSSLERALMTAIGQTLSLNPTLINLPLNPSTHAQATDINPYYYLLFGDNCNYEAVLKIIESINRFYKAKDPSLPTLGSYLGKVSGIQVLTHSLESSTLPTWHTLFTNELTDRTHKKVTDSQFATKVNFLAQRPTYTGKLVFPTAVEDIEPKLYQVEKKKFNPTECPVQYLTFSARDNVHPDALWYQPYSKNTSSISHSLILGLKIESEELDATIIPIPNPTSTLIDTNSSYLAGSVPINKIKPIYPLNTQHLLPVRDRKLKESNDPISIIRRDCSTNALTTFSADHVNTDFNGAFGYTRENNHDDQSAGTTYCAWPSDKDCPYPDDTLYLWSSYRHNNGCKSPEKKKLYMYYSLRPFYGLNTVLSQTRGPAKMLPF